MIIQAGQLTLHTATWDDRQQIANLLHFGAYVHRHLDWRPPLDWIGRSPFIVARRNDDLVAALACPPDPPNTAWIRLLTVAPGFSVDQAWEELWSCAFPQLIELTGPLQAAAIPLQSWFQRLLENSGFEFTHRVVVLAWNKSILPAPQILDSLNIRPMLLDDIAQVEKIDAAAFGGVWQNTQSCLEIAFRQAAVATVAEYGGSLVGYQISTATQMGGHLARLAVLPERQGFGIGYALMHDMLTQFERRGLHHITVNTQHDNKASLYLYQKAGFQRTGEEYPLFQLRVE